MILDILARSRDPGPPVTIMTLEALRLACEPVADCNRLTTASRRGDLMERAQILEAMGELKLYGNDRVKRALMIAADIARKIDPDLAEIFWRLMTTKGHHHKQALCAVADRLVNRIFSVMRRGKASRPSSTARAPRSS